MEKYYVTLINNKTKEETNVLTTFDKVEAIKRAQSEKHCNDRDKTNYSVEIREYVEDIDSEECECFDYNVVDF